MTYQFTILQNQNIAVAKLGDDCPDHAEKMALAQFGIGETIELSGKPMLIEGVTVRPFKGTAVALTVWHICYYLKDMTKPEGVHSAPELEVLLSNKSNKRGYIAGLMQTQATNILQEAMNNPREYFPTRHGIPVDLGWEASS